MSAITPQTALPARSVTPSGAVTCNSSRLRLYAVIDASQGEASLKLVRQLEGGDWQYVPGGSLSISAYTNAADKVNELIVPNAGAGTVYHVVGVGSTAVLATIRCYLAEIVDSVVSGTVTADGVQELTNKTLTSPVVKTGLTASGSASNDFSGSTGTFLTSTGLNTIGGDLLMAAGKVVGFGAPQALSGAGAVNVTTLATLFTSTGAAQALTLADGTRAGQLKFISHVVDGGSGVLTPTTKTGFTTVTFTAVNDWACLIWSGSAWFVLAVGGATIA